MSPELQVRLSHPLSDQRTPGSVIEWERFDPSPGPIPEENIVRPGYKKARWGETRRALCLTVVWLY